MSKTANGQSELWGWKEIAHYLGVTVRAAQKWEKEKGLPVRRLAGVKGRVSASAAELEQWRQAITLQPQMSGYGIVSDSRPANHAHMNPEASHARAAFASRQIRWDLAAVAGIFAIIGTAFYFLYYLPGPPARGRVEKNTLIVSDAKGREVWRKEFREALLTDYSEPRARYRVWTGDLEGDGQIETLFAQVYLRSRTVTDGSLICYSQEGREKWRFKPGRPVETADEKFPSDYWPTNFVVASMGTGRPHSIVVSSIQNVSFPTQIALLSAQGELQREYWHSGIIGGAYFGDIVVADLDHNGISEIYLGGVSNSYKLATLIALDPDTMGGASVEELPHYRFLGFEPGRERARLLFPANCITQAEKKYAGVTYLDTHDGQLIASIPPLEDVAAIQYDFGPDLRLLRLEVGDGFETRHVKLYRNGTLDHEWSPGKEEPALRNLLYLRRPPQVSASAAAAK